MAKSKPKTTDKTQDLSKQLLKHYDDFTEFHDSCAFLCEAFASIALTHDGLDSNMARGLEYHAHWLTSRATTLKKELRQIQEQAFAKTD